MKKRYLLMPLAIALAAAGGARGQGLPCTTPITSYPYFENFEAGAGGWTDSGSGLWAWGTPAKTLIQGAASGTKAWITDLSSPYPNSANAQVVSPCYNFSSLTAPRIEMKIWWDAESSWDGTVLQSSIDGGLSWQNVGNFGDPNNWYNDNSMDGRPGGSNVGWSSEGTGYVVASHALTGLAGQANVRLRFAFGSDASGNNDGFAFDDVRISQPSASDVGVIAVVAPQSGASCAIGSQTVTIRVVNFGSTAQSNIPVSYTVNGGTAVTGTVPGPIAPGDSALYSFTAPFNITAGGTYVFAATTNLTGDADASNNSSGPTTLTVTLPITVSATTAYFQNFESGAGGWTAGGAVSSWALGTPAKTLIQGAASGTNAWVTGLTGTYLSNERSFVTSPCFNFAALTLPRIEMKIWWESEAGWDGAVLQSSINGGATWQNVGAFGDPNNWYNNNSLDGRPGGSNDGWAGQTTAGSGAYVTAVHNLTGLAGQSSVRLRIAFGSDASFNSDGFAFDDIRISQPGANDVGVVAITSPFNATLCSSGPQTVTVRVANFGSAPQSNIPVSYTANGGTPVTATIAGPLAPGDTVTYSFTTPFNVTMSGTYVFTATTNLTGDANTTNNGAGPVTLNITTPIVVTGTNGYFQNFESGAGGWTAGGPNSTWALGTPAKTVIQGAASGQNAWVTSLTGDYSTGENSYVLSPCFDFSALALPTIDLKIWWESEAGWDGAVLQSSINGGGTWQNVGAFGDPDNWYNDNSLDNRPGGSMDGWAGRTSSNNGSGGYLLARHAMASLAGQSSVRLRIAFGSDGSVVDDGFAFDDINIYQPAPNDVGVTAVASPGSATSCATGVAVPVTITVRNFGSAPQTNIPVSYTVNGGTPVTGTIAGPVAPNASVNFTFVTPFTPTAAGVYTIVVRTGLTTDGNASNNASAPITYSIITPITITRATPYTQNFESGSGGWATGSTGSSWALGTPAKATIQGAASGQNAWVTSLTGQYANNEQSTVVSPCFDFSGLNLPVIEFKTWWDLDFDDGVVLQSSIDGGVSWQNVGNSGDPNNWFNESGMTGQPGGQGIGWSGVQGGTNPPGSNGYVTAMHEMPTLANQSSVRFRFALGTTGFTTNDGFAFDDVRIYGITAPPTKDLGVAAILQPLAGCALTASEVVVVQVKNYGTQAQTGYQVIVKYQQVSPTVGALRTMTANVTTPIAAGGNAAVVMGGANLSAPNACFEFNAYTVLAGDTVTMNDTASTTICSRVIPVTAASPYQENFDGAAATGWTSYGANSTWAVGTPAKSTIQGAASGQNAWVTNLTGNYNSNELSAAYSPCFNLTGIANPVVQMKLWWSAETGRDGVTLQYSTDNGSVWTTLGNVNDPDNWFNSATIAGLAPTSGKGWTGAGAAGSQGYQLVRHDLNGTGAAGAAQVRFRVLFGASTATPPASNDTDDGAAFDDFSIYEKPAQDIGTLGVMPIGGTCGFGTSECIQVRVKNFGSQTANNFTVTYAIAGTPALTGSVTVTTPLAPGLEVLVPVGCRDLSAFTSVNLTVSTSLTGDQIAFNDTLSTTFAARGLSALPFAPIDFEATGSNLARFAAANGSLASINELPGRGNGNTRGLVLTGRGGAWTDPIGGTTNPFTINLPHLATLTLCLDATAVDTVGHPFSMSFDLRQVALGSGAFFFNTNFRVLINGTQVGPLYRPPVSGSGTWGTYTVDLRPYAGNRVTVQFQSSVNRSFNGTSGDANFLDNINVTATLRITGRTADAVFGRGVSVYPNPSAGVVRVALDHAGNHVYDLALTDLTGRVIRRLQTSGANHTETELNLTALARGVYMLRVSDEAGRLTVRKLTLE